MPMVYADETVRAFAKSTGAVSLEPADTLRERLAEWAERTEGVGPLEAWEIRTGRPWTSMTAREARALQRRWPSMLRNPAVREQANYTDPWGYPEEIAQDRAIERLKAEAAKPRRTGATTRHCHEVADAIERGDTEVMILLPKLGWTRHVLPMLESVLRDRGIGELRRSEHSRWVFSVSGTTVAVKSSAMAGVTLGWRGTIVEFFG